MSQSFACPKCHVALRLPPQPAPARSCGVLFAGGIIILGFGLIIGAIAGGSYVWFLPTKGQSPPPFAATPPPPTSAPVGVLPPVAADMGPLTAEEKAAWVKFRRGEKQGTILLRFQQDGWWGYGDVDSGAHLPNRWTRPDARRLWRFGGNQESIVWLREQIKRYNEGFIRYEPSPVPGWEQEITEIETDLKASNSGITPARRVAIEAAKQPQVRCAVILDLFGGEAPRILEWYRDDGSGVRRLNGPPDAETANSLQQQLLEIVRSAGR